MGETWLTFPWHSNRQLKPDQYFCGELKATWVELLVAVAVVIHIAHSSRQSRRATVAHKYCTFRHHIHKNRNFGRILRWLLKTRYSPEKNAMSALSFSSDQHFSGVMLAGDASIFWYCPSVVDSYGCQVTWPTTQALIRRLPDNLHCSAEVAIDWSINVNTLAFSAFNT